MDKNIQPIIQSFLHDYRGRYSQYWVRRFGLIPELATSYDNSYDIYDLLAWLQRGFKHLLDDFLNLELEFEQFKNALLELLEVLIPQLIREFAHSEEFENLIRELMKEFVKELWFKETIRDYMKEFVKEKWFQDILREYMKEFVKEEWFKDLIETYIKESKTVEDIWKKLTELEALINALMGRGTYKTLNYGTDYTLQFYNGFYVTDNDRLHVAINENDFTATLQITGNNNLPFRNDNLENARLRHSNPVNEVPESWMFRIQFLNDYAWLNSASYNIAISPNNIWNIRGNEDSRGSWTVNCGTNRATSIGSTGILYSAVSISDGYNSQFDVYGSHVWSTWINFDTRLVFNK